MCGICGFVSFAGWPPAMLQAMNDVIFRRGPDGEGSLHSGTVGLAMRRLAIIDVAGGAQPVYNEDRSVAVVFNGEIYNYRSLREGLRARGHEFRSNSDTEVLVHLYEERGADLVRELEGMFAFALWDSRKQALLLARDRLGIKPLFIAQLAGGVLFGSEIKALLATGLVSRELDRQALDQFLTYTFIPAPRTIYRAITRVAPGTTVTIGPKAEVSARCYWEVPDPQVVQRTPAEWAGRVEGGLLRAVESHLVSDVPVGAFLSGGVDSGLMVAMMAAATERPVETFTVGFADAGSSFIDERVYARMIAQRYRLNHHEINVEPRVTDIIQDIVAAFDEPFADDSVIPSYYVSQAAARFVKVALTGLGGDELFGGYRRHLGVRVGDAYRGVPRWLRERVVDPIIRRLPEPRTSSDLVDHLKRFSRASSASPSGRYQDSMSALPATQRARLYSRDTLSQLDLAATAAILTDTFDGFRHGTSVDRALKTDLRWYLADDILTLTDRLSMWHSLELRVPYLDHRFVEEVMSIPANLKIRGFNQKRILKQVAAKWLPAPVIKHRKQGFEAPMGRWLRGPLKSRSPRAHVVRASAHEGTVRRFGHRARGPRQRTARAAALCRARRAHACAAGAAPSADSAGAESVADSGRAGRRSPRCAWLPTHRGRPQRGRGSVHQSPAVGYPAVALGDSPRGPDHRQQPPTRRARRAAGRQGVRASRPRTGATACAPAHTRRRIQRRAHRHFCPR
ncbi:MAG: asparagine synthase (glutamine-hydrolyzing) [Gammaproteobacteria bacterium]|nr:MAG: asparagine synthase (glutamine-hydrolyzing) [Gammaproteobacteria bacterium]